MKLSKTEFLKYKECSSYAWFYKNKQEVLTKKEIDPFIQSLIDQGAEVEDWACKRFPNGVYVRSFHEKAVDTTQKLIKAGKTTIFQATFADEELHAMIDILQWNDLLNAWDIYEVKSTSSQADQESGKRKDEHIDDAGFQRILLQRLGMKVANVYLMTLNKEYIKNGPLDVEKLFIVDEITDKLFEMEDLLKRHINDALQNLNSSTEPTSCDCKYRSRKKHCEAFNYLYPQTPPYSVYDINRIGNSPKLLESLIDQKILSLSDINDVSKFNKMKLWQWKTFVDDEEIILAEKIKLELESLQYPLYFLDYETLPSAIPKYDGSWPHQQVVIQYSIHIIKEEGAVVQHKEYLHTRTDAPFHAVAENLRKDIGDEGSIIVWYKPFEQPRTKETAAMVPELHDFLISVHDRIYDLMDIITKGYYVHKDFRGSASIKAVLPVMCPELSYKSLRIQNGGQAVAAYNKLIFTEDYKGKEQEVIDDLLAYCKLDTWAMVRIWEEMWKKVS